MKEKLIQILKNAIKEKYNLEITEINLEIPPKKEFGDFAFGTFLLAKDLKKNPNLIAEELKDFLLSSCHPSAHEDLLDDNLEIQNLIENVSVAGPYLNIKLDKSIFTKSFLEISEKDIFTEEKEINKDETIIIDYIGANVGKPLHIGHMCTPNQGQVIINLYKKLGYNVISDSHIGDWGIIFGKLIFAYKKWGDEEKLKQNAVDYLLELYVKVTAEVEKESSAISHQLSENEKINSEKQNTESGKLKTESSMDQQIRDEFKLLSEGNPESIELWRKFTKYSIEAMNVQLGRLNVKSDYNIGESFYEGLGLPKMEDYPDLKYNMSEIVKELITKKIATKNDDNSVGIIFSDDTKIPSCMLQKRDGTHGYLASDLACIKYRMQNWKPDKIIYFVANEQILHFRQVFEISKNAGWLDLGKRRKEKGEREKVKVESEQKEILLGINNNELNNSLKVNSVKDFEINSEGQVKTELFHAYNGFISLKGGKMSSRKGNIIKLSDLLDEAEIRAKKIILEKRDDLDGEELENLAKIIGIGAIKYGYLKKNRETDVIFDWDEFMSFEGNSGPYIQYAYVRAIRILENGPHPNPLILEEREQKVFFEKDEEIELVKKLLDYKDILIETANKNMPHILAGYSYELTKIFNSFYNSVQVLGEKDEVLKNLRLLLVKKFSEILKESFEILGIKMPEKM